MLVECTVIVMYDFTLTLYYILYECHCVHCNYFVPIVHNAVPMDLDVKMKAVMLGATFLIVSHPV